MKIEAESFKIEMTHNETYSTAWDIRRALEHTLRTHWINHQLNWREHEKDRLYRLQTFFNSLGRQDLHEDIFRLAIEIFTEFNAKK